ncbi:MAG: helix-turn-helix domain-containing protein [Defluviitaleaceae bacterium]|nr:helix-turn-helix domain-containing protein [Defluviitaleaceae bacterium]
MASLGSRISEYRRQRNITQEQLAEIMGVTSQAVSKWENDISCPDIGVMPQLADYFGVSLDRLLRGEESGAVRMMPAGERKAFDQLVLRIKVLSADGDKVKVNLPMPLLKAGIEIGALMNMSAGSNDALKNIDFAAIIKMVESGMMGNLVEVNSADGHIITVSVE